MLYLLYYSPIITPPSIVTQHNRGSSIIARRYHQEVGIPQTLNISPPGLLHGKGGSDDQSESDNSDEELASPTAQAAQRKKEAVHNKPVNRLLYTPRKNKPAGSRAEAAKSVDSQQKLMEAVGESKAAIADVQAKVDHFLSQEWPNYAMVFNNTGEITDHKLNNLHRMVNNIATTCAMLESTVAQMKEQPISNKSMDLMVEKLFGMYESRYAEAEHHQENAISSLAWHPPSGILLGAWEAPKPSRIILLCSDALQAAPGAPVNFPQSHRSISQHSYHFLGGPQTCSFAYSAPRASLTLRSPHCQLASYVTLFIDHAVNSSLLLQASSREICINRHL